MFASRSASATVYKKLKAFPSLQVASKLNLIPQYAIVKKISQQCHENEVFIKLILAKFRNFRIKMFLMIKILFSSGSIPP